MPEISVLGKISSITILAISHTTSRGQTRSPHDNFRSFLQKTALTLARGIKGFRGQIQTDCKWEIQVRNKSEESKWTEWFSEFFVKDGEGENQIFRSFYKKRNTSTEKHMSKHCHLSLNFYKYGCHLDIIISDDSSVIPRHDPRHSRQKVPSTPPTLTSPQSPSSASVSSHSSSLQVLTVFLVNDDIDGSWPMIIKINIRLWLKMYDLQSKKRAKI